MVATQSLAYLDLKKLADTKLNRKPYEYLIVSDFLSESSKKPLIADFPGVPHIGSFPISKVTYGPAFQKLVDELLSAEFAQVVGEKFGLDLSQYSTMITVRGQCSATSDGKIHTDSKDKVITVLLYMNDDWGDQGGRLRVLRSKNLEDYAAEIEPSFGTLLIFKRSDCSWHGHKPFQGKRMSLQMNWVRSEGYQKKEQMRHALSSWVKRVFGISMRDPNFY